jgi:hypothetical protein
MIKIKTEGTSDATEGRTVGWPSNSKLEGLAGAL